MAAGTAVMDVAGYRRLVAEMAISSWWMYPPKTRAYIDVEDMIQDGIIYARVELAKSYNPNRGKFTTLLYRALPNFYRNRADELNAKKRFDGFSLSTDELESLGIEVGYEEE